MWVRRIQTSNSNMDNNTIIAQVFIAWLPACKEREGHIVRVSFSRGSHRQWMKVWISHPSSDSVERAATWGWVAGRIGGRSSGSSVVGTGYTASERMSEGVSGDEADDERRRNHSLGVLNVCLKTIAKYLLLFITVKNNRRNLIAQSVFSSLAATALHSRRYQLVLIGPRKQPAQQQF